MTISRNSMGASQVVMVVVVTHQNRDGLPGVAVVCPDQVVNSNTRRGKANSQRHKVDPDVLHLQGCEVRLEALQISLGLSEGECLC